MCKQCTCAIRTIQDAWNESPHPSVSVRGARAMDGWRVGAPATRPPHTRARSGHTHARTMAFILGGFSHLFAFKGAFQAEVRASSRETRRPPASRMTTTTTTKGDATRAATDEWNGMDDDDDDAGGCG